MNCTKCNGTGASKVNADGSKVRCWNCQGNGLEPPYPYESRLDTARQAVEFYSKKPVEDWEAQLADWSRILSALENEQ